MTSSIITTRHFFVYIGTITFLLIYNGIIQGQGTDSSKRRQHRPQDTTTDKKVERGKPVSDQITAEELYDAYKEIRNEYDLKAFRCPDGETNEDSEDCGGNAWKVLRKTADGIEVSMLHHPSDPQCPYVKMSAVMPGSIEDVWDYLSFANWDDNMPQMDPFYEGLSVVRRYRHEPLSGGQSKLGRNGQDDHTVELVLARKRTKRILAFGKRDFTFVSVSDAPREDGVRVSGTISVVTDKMPRYKGYTRAFQDSVVFYEPLPPDDDGFPRSKLTIVCRIDLNDRSEGGAGGNIPMWIYVKTVGASGVLSMGNMRNGIKKHAMERIKNQKTDGESDVGADTRKRVRLPHVPWFATKSKYF